MLVVVSMPYEKERWSFFAFGVLGNHNTCHFRSPLCCQRSGRLFLGGFLIACHKTLTDNKTRIAIGIAPHATGLTEHQGRTVGISLCWLRDLIPSHQAMATSTFSTGIAWADPAGENAFVIRFVFGVREDASLHPKGAFAIASVAVLAFGRFEIAQVFKHQDGRPVLFSKLDNASTHQMREVFICSLDLAPEVNVVRFTLRYD